MDLDRNADRSRYGRLIEIIVHNTIHAPHTFELVKEIGKELGLEKEIIYEHAVKAGFFKPEGLEKLAKYLGIKDKVKK